MRSARWSARFRPVCLKNSFLAIMRRHSVCPGPRRCSWPCVRRCRMSATPYCSGAEACMPLPPREPMVTSHRVSADSSVRSLGAEIIDSIDLPILVAGRDYTVASFNQAAAAFFSLAPADVGRSLGEIPVLSSVKRLAELCEDAVAHGASCQGEVRDAIGSWFVLRIAPYRGRDQQIAGAVLTLTNV